MSMCKHNVITIQITYLHQKYFTHCKILLQSSVFDNSEYINCMQREILQFNTALYKNIYVEICQNLEIHYL